MLIRLFTLISALLPVVSVYGQDCHVAMHGTVYDRTTGQGLPYASVAIPLLGIGTTADEHGHYTIANLCDNQEYQVHVSHVNCAHQISTVRITENTTTDFYLEHSEHELKTVTIEAKAIELQSAQSEGKIETLELQNSQSRSLADAVAQIPGVYQISAGQNTSKPMIQGLSGNRIAIVQQGTVVEGQQWGADHAPEVDLFSAEEVTVIKGAAGVRYGPGALGGAVVLEAAPWHERAAHWAETGASLNGRAGWAAVSTEYLPKAKKSTQWMYRLQASVKLSGNQRTPDYYLDNTSSREQNLRLTIRRERGKGTTTAFGSVYHQKFGIMRSAHTGNLTDLLAAIEAPQPLNNRDVFGYGIAKPFQDVTHLLARLQHEQRINGRWRWESAVNWQYNIRQEYDAHRNGKKDNELRPALSLYNYTLLTESAWKHKPVRHWTGEFGVQGTWQYNQTGTGGYVPDQLTWAGALYAIEHWRRYPTPIEWEFGLRADARTTHVTDTFGTLRMLDTVLQFANVSASAGLIYAPNEYWLLRLNSALAWRPPGMIELYARGVHHGAASYEAGTPGLKPEVGWNQSTEIRYSRQRLTISVSGFAHAINHFIYLQPTGRTILTVRGAYPYNEYRQSNAFLTGADATLGFRLVQQLGVVADWSMLRGWSIGTKNLDGSRAWLPLMPPDRLRLALVLDGQGKYWSVARAAAWSGKLTWSHFDRQHRIPAEGILMEPPPAYGLWSAELNYTKNLSKSRMLTLGLSSENLFDARYRSYLNSFRYFADEPGRQVSARARLKF